MKILFSPAGSRDPIALFDSDRCADGSMLHCCRHLLPDKVYIFLSKEMTEYHRKDDRYVKSLRLLEKNLKEAKDIEHHFDVRVIEHPDLENVHIFDSIYRLIKSEIRKIADENPEEAIMLNVSSGTPAMKSALQIIASMYDKFDAYQVDTPKYGHNSRENPDDFDIETYWEFNVDSLDFGSKNENKRVKHSPYINFVTDMTKELAIRHVDRYDYDAALDAISGTKFDGTIIEQIIKAAKKRICLDWIGFCRELETTGLSRADIAPDCGDNRELAEYIMWLETKTALKDWNDFANGVTPALTRILYIAIKRDGENIPDNMKWDFQSASRFSRFGVKPGSYVTNGQLLDIAGEIQTLSGVFKDLKIIKDFEDKIRHRCAHSLVSFNDKEIKEETDFHPSDIMNKIKSLVSKICGIRPESMNAYQIMNKEIRSLIKRYDIANGR